jgi:hypothetical protein
MAKSSSTPIEFPPKAFLIGGLLAWLLAIVAVISAFTAHQPLVLILAVFWIAISVLCIRSWLAKK